MNENKIEELMQRYSESIGTCSRQPVQMPSQLRWRRPVALISSLAAVAAISIAVWPREAMAARLHRMRGAVLNAKTMEVESWMQREGGSWRLFAHTYARDGMRRGEYRQGTPMQCTNVCRDGLFLMDYQQLDHATLEPLDPDYSPEDAASPSNALDFVEQAIDVGRAGLPRKIQVRDHAPMGSTPTYLVTLDRPEDKYHAEILVDRGTDLPISSEISVQGPRDQVNYRNLYTFNRPIADSMFAMTSQKPVINLIQAQDELTLSWLKPVATEESSEIRNACITSDGSIWIAISAHEPSEPFVLPSSIETQSGVSYVRLQDVNPAAILAMQNRFSFKGESVFVAVFVPLDPTAPQPSDVAVRFTRRDPWYLGSSSPTSSAEVAISGSVRLHLHAENGDRPSYFSTLDLDHFGFQLPIIVWDARAKALEKSGHFVGAAKAYEVEADKYGGFIPSLAAKALKSAAKCYKSAGKLAEADRDLAMISKIQH